MERGCDSQSQCRSTLTKSPGQTHGRGTDILADLGGTALDRGPSICKIWWWARDILSGGPDLLGNPRLLENPGL